MWMKWCDALFFWVYDNALLPALLKEQQMSIWCLLFCLGYEHMFLNILCNITMLADAKQMKINSENGVSDHFSQMEKMVNVCFGAEREMEKPYQSTGRSLTRWWRGKILRICRFQGLKKCNVAMPTDAKTNEARLENDALRLFMSAGNAEYSVFHGSKRIMQRCNKNDQKTGYNLQRCSSSCRDMTRCFL